MIAQPEAGHRSALEKLTPAQRDCLRRVYRLQTSKQIARELGISRHTVDQRIMLACRKLGVSSRSEAALLLAGQEAIEGENGQTHPAFPIAAPAMPQMANGHAHAEPLVVPMPFLARRPDGGPSGAPETGIGWPLPRRDHAENRLSILQRLGWTLAICGISILLFGVLVTAIYTLGRLI